MKTLNCFLLSSACAGLVACQSASQDSNAPIGQSAQKGEVITECASFQDFFVDYLAMKEQEGGLREFSDETQRRALAASKLTSHLMNSHRSLDQEEFIQKYKWIFDQDGLPRSKPSHPLTNQCLKE